MKVKFQSSCSGCRIPNSTRKATVCRWKRYGRDHRWRWRYIIEHNGQRLATSSYFGTKERAERSATRKWLQLYLTIKDICENNYEEKVDAY
jgi:hypothetical protein